MNVLCFGGSHDQQVVSGLSRGDREFHAVKEQPPELAGLKFERETYVIYRGRNDETGSEWRFAVVAGMEPTDEMAERSRPLSRAETTERDWQLEADKREAKRIQGLRAAVAFYNAVEGASKASREF